MSYYYARLAAVTKPATSRIIIGDGGYWQDLTHIKPPGSDRVLCGDRPDVMLDDSSAFVTTRMGATCSECRERA